MLDKSKGDSFSSENLSCPPLPLRSFSFYNIPSLCQIQISFFSLRYCSSASLMSILYQILIMRSFSLCIQISCFSLRYFSSASLKNTPYQTLFNLSVRNCFVLWSSKNISEKFDWDDFLFEPDVWLLWFRFDKFLFFCCPCLWFL